MGVPATIDEGDMGRPPIVYRDRERAENALKAVRKGHTTTMAAQAAGVTRRTVYNWIERGRQIRQLKEEEPERLPVTAYDDDYLWFLKQWEKAEYERKQTLLGRIDKAGKEKWQANAWLLERLHPEEFSSKREVRVSRDGEDRVFRLNMGGSEVKEAVEGEDFEILDDD